MPTVNKFLITAICLCLLFVIALDASNKHLARFTEEALLARSSATSSATAESAPKPTVTTSGGGSTGSGEYYTTSSTQQPPSLTTPITGTTTLGGKQAVNREMNQNPTTPQTISRTLSIYSPKSAKNDVIILQNFLITNGYLKGTADGKFGFATRKAVILFQKEYGITATGNVGPITLKKMNAIIGGVDLGQKGLVN